MILWVAGNGYLDDVAVDKVAAWEEAFHRYMDATHPEIGQGFFETTVTNQKKISNEQFEQLRAAVVEFKKSAPQ
jgi:F-type H+-transporting ATPase subunit alpha